MTLTKANEICNRINNLKIGYLADVEQSDDDDFSVVVRHAELGNEVGFARDADEAEYIAMQIESRCRDEV